MARFKNYKTECAAVAEHWHLSLKVLERKGAVLCDAEEIRRATKGACGSPGVGWVYHDLKGKPTKQTRYRVTDPSRSTDGRKYHSANASGQWEPHLWLDPQLDWERIARDVSKPLLLCEGEAEAAYANTQKGIPAAAGYPGAQAFQSQGELATEYAQLQWFKEHKGQVERRRVYVVPDSDVRDNEDVAKWASLHLDALRELGADVAVVPLPNVTETYDPARPEKQKTGCGDYLYFAGTSEFKKLLACALSPDDEWVKSWNVTSSAIPEPLRDWTSHPFKPTEFVMPPYWTQNQTTMVNGESGAGKTFFTIHGGQCMATGADFFGITNPMPKRKVLFLELERSLDDLLARCMAVAKETASGLPAKTRDQWWADLRANFHPVRRRALRVIKLANAQWEMDLRLARAVVRYLKRHGFQGVFLEPLSRLHGTNENDNSAANAVMDFFEYVLEEMGHDFFISVNHHTGQNLDGKSAKYSGRGASAWADSSSNTVRMIVLSSEAAEGEGMRLEKGEAIIKVECPRRSAKSSQDVPDLYLQRGQHSGVLFSAERTASVAKESVTKWLPAMHELEAGKRSTEGWTANALAKLATKYEKKAPDHRVFKAICERGVQFSVLRRTVSGKGRGQSSRYLLEVGYEETRKK